jgi:hypothetical protein
MMKVRWLFLGLSPCLGFLSIATTIKKNLVGREDLIKAITNESAKPDSQNEKTTMPPERKRSPISSETVPVISVPEENSNSSAEAIVTSPSPPATPPSEASNQSNRLNSNKSTSNSQSSPTKTPLNTKGPPVSNATLSKSATKTISFSGVMPAFHSVSGFQSKGSLNTLLNNGLFGEVKPMNFSHNYPSLFTPISPITVYTPPLFSNSTPYFSTPFFMGASPVTSFLPQNTSQPQNSTTSQSLPKKDSRPCLEACNAMISAYENQSFVDGFQLLSNDKKRFALNIRSDVNQDWNNIQALDSAAEQKKQFEKMCKGAVGISIDNKNKKQTNIFFRETEDISSDMKKQVEACKSNMKTAAQNPPPTQPNPTYTASSAYTNPSANYKYDSGGGAKAPVGPVTATYKLVEPGPPGPNGEWAPGTYWEKVTPQASTPPTTNATPPTSPTPAAANSTTQRALAAFPKN